MKYRIQTNLFTSPKEVVGTSFEVRENGDLVVYSMDWWNATSRKNAGGTCFSVPQKIVAAYSAGFWNSIEEDPQTVTMEYEMSWNEANNETP